MKKSSGNCSDTNMDLNTKQAIQSAAEEKPSRCILQQIQCFRCKDCVKDILQMDVC